MNIGLVAATIRNNRVDEQINEIRHYLSTNSNCDLLCFGEAFLHGFNGMSWEYEVDINRAITLDSQQMDEIRETLWITTDVFLRVGKTIGKMNTMQKGQISKFLNIKINNLLQHYAVTFGRIILSKK